ncbi:MAG: D-alanine--D-alanine ligase [Planctomycetota bacterium]
MKIGLTYDLRDDYLALGWHELDVAEFDRADTITAIAEALAALGHEPVRVGGVRALVAALARGERWDAVWNIAEGTGRFGREAAIPALLEEYGIPVLLADPLNAALTLHKGYTKRVLRDRGVPTTGFCEVRDEGDVAGVDLGYPVFLKPVAEGSSKGVATNSRARNAAELLATARELLARYQQPVLVEPYLPGREFTVGVIGDGPRTEALGALEVVLLDAKDDGIYTYDSKEECEVVVEYRLATDALALEACALARRAWIALDCRDAGRVDVRADAGGALMVLEVNPLPGMHPEHSDLPILASKLGLSYLELMRRIVGHGLARIAREPLPQRGPAAPPKAERGAAPKDAGAPCTS